MGVNSLPKTVTRQRRDCDLNTGPTEPESSTLTTRLPSHQNQHSSNGKCEKKLGQNSKKTTSSTDRQRFRVGCVFLCVLLADTEIIVDGVVFTLGAVGVGGPRAAVTVRVAWQTHRRVVGDVDELVGATLAHAETTHTLPVVLARVTVLHAFLRARPALLVARHTALCTADMELGHWVTGSMDNFGQLSRPGHQVIVFIQPCARQTRNWVTGSMGHLGQLSRPGHQVIVFIQPCARKQQDSHRPQTSPADQPRCGCGRAEGSTFICDICL